MNDQSNNEALNRREVKRQRRAESNSGWIVGVILIPAIGVSLIFGVSEWFLTIFIFPHLESK